MKYHYTLILFFIAALFFSCNQPPQPVTGKITGWAPVYSNDPGLLKIVSDTPHATLQAGKVYASGHFIYQNETDKGIHVIDISDPEAPDEIAFIKIAGSTELAVRGHYLYSNNLNDLVVVDISDPLHVREVFRIPNGFGMESALYPPGHGYFECADPSKGTVTGWEQKELNNPRCYR